MGGRERLDERAQNPPKKVPRKLSRYTPQALLRDDGSVAIVTAIALPVLIGVGALAIDGSRLYVARNQLQAAADAGALAGAKELNDTLQSYNNACEYAYEYTKRNMADKNSQNSLFVKIEIGRWNPDDNEFKNIATCDFTKSSYLEKEDLNKGPSPSAGQKAIRTTPQRSATANNAVQFFLAGVFGVDSGDVRASAVAVKNAGANACILSKRPGKVIFNSGSGVELENCGIGANSDEADAFRFNSGSHLTAGALISPGNVVEAQGSHVNVDQRLVGKEEYAKEDRFQGRDFVEDLENPYSGSPENWPSKQGGKGKPQTIDPGYYRNVNVSGRNITLNPGVYYIKGDMNFNSGSEISGTDVTIVLLDGNYNANSGSRQNFSAPRNDTSNDGRYGNQNYEDVLIYKPESGSMNINSGSQSTLDGVIYAPSTDITWNSGSRVSRQCNMLVGRSLTFNSGSRFYVDCDEIESVSSSSGGSDVRLVR